MQAAHHTLFVYGTLRRGANTALARQLLADARWLGIGTLRGLLYQIDHYPGLVESNHAGWVTGDLYQLPADATLWQVLDEYEGCAVNSPLPHEYQRVLRPVSLESGEIRQAYVYVYQRSVEGKPLIESGDFLKGAAP